MQLIRIPSVIAALLLAGCAVTPSGSAEAPQASAKQAVMASAATTSASRAGGGPRLGWPDPQASTRRTGGRQATAEEAARHAPRAKRVKDVRLTPLAIERIADSVNSGQNANGAGSVSAADLSALAAQATPLGSDLLLGSASAQKTGGIAPPTTTTATATTTTSYTSGAAAASLPKFVDNSTLKSFPPIANQGGLGSCETFAIAYYQYTHEVGLLANWDNQSPNSTDKTKFSPKWLYNLSNGGEDDGTYEGTNYDLLLDHGALTLADFPYVGDASNPINYREWPVGASVWEKALTYKGVSHATLTVPTDSTSMQQVKTALLNGHVLTFFNFIYGWQYDQLDNDPNTSADDAYVGQQVATWVSGSDGGHLMTLVGYDDDLWVDLNGNGRVDSGEKGAFKIANSWGNGYGNAGFMWVLYDALYSTSQVSGMPAQPDRTPAMLTLNSVVVRATYQPNLVAEFTLGTAERSNLSLSIGMAETDAKTSFNGRSPLAFSGGMGGPYAFDGTTTTQAKTASFAVDVTDFAASYGDLVYSAQLNNYSTIADTLSGLTFLDHLKNNQRTASTDPAMTVNQYQTKAQTLRYQFIDSAHVPNLTLNPDASMAFGNYAVGSSLGKLLSVQNTGTGDAILTSLRFNNALFYVTETAPLTIQAGTTSQLHVQFAPASAQSETATLTVKNTSSNAPSAALALTGTGASNNNNAPLVLYLTQQSDPLDSNIAMRIEIKNRSTSTQTIANDRVIYYLNYAAGDYSTLVWDTYYNSGPAPLTAKLRHAYLTLAYGQRTADTALEFTFPSGTALAAGTSLIFQGSLHRPDYSWYPDETHDWSRYLRRDTMAESSVIQDINSKSIVFGSGPELPAGAFKLAVTPNPVVDTATFTIAVTDSKYVHSEFFLEIRDANGNYMTAYYQWVDALGTFTMPLSMSGWPAGDYSAILRTDNATAVDVVTFKKS